MGKCLIGAQFKRAILGIVNVEGCIGLVAPLGLDLPGWVVGGVGDVEDGAGSGVQSVRGVHGDAPTHHVIGESGGPATGVGDGEQVAAVGIAPHGGGAGARVGGGGRAPVAIVGVAHRGDERLPGAVPTLLNCLASLRTPSLFPGWLGCPVLVDAIGRRRAGLDEARGHGYRDR